MPPQHLPSHDKHGARNQEKTRPTRGEEDQVAPAPRRRKTDTSLQKESESGEGEGGGVGYGEGGGGGGGGGGWKGPGLNDFEKRPVWRI